MELVSLTEYLRRARRERHLAMLEKDLKQAAKDAEKVAVNPMMKDKSMVENRLKSAMDEQLKNEIKIYLKGKGKLLL